MDSIISSILANPMDVFNLDVPLELRKLIDEPVNDDLIKKNKYANNSAYIPESIYIKMLNQITNRRWSFIPFKSEVVSGKDGNYAQYTGLLIVPGFGIHTGIGTQPMNKKDNQNAMAAAKTYAFKNACKEMGLAPNVGNDDFDEQVYASYEEKSDVKDKPKESTKKKKKDKGARSERREEPSDKPSLKDRIKELRDAHELDDDDEFVAFLQVWNEEILDVDDMSKEDWKEFFAFYKKNPKKFEDF